MSTPRLHEELAAFYDSKNPDLFQKCLSHQNFADFQKKFDLKIETAEFVRAFTHTSFTHEFKLPHHEQLEFLGDSVLQLILTEELYRLYPEEKEGRLSKLRSSMVNEKALAQIARWLDLGSMILVGRGEFIKKLFEQDPVLADAFEAMIGQIYRHHGLEFTRTILLNWVRTGLPEAFKWEFLEHFDAKSKLQEMSLAKYKKLPRYESVEAGDKFEVNLYVNDQKILAGIFPSKKSGEKELAHEAIRQNLV